MSAVEEYLDRLTARLQGPPAHVGRLASEIRDHLAESVEALTAAGTDEADAAEQAVARFGPVETVARSMNRATWARYRRPLLAEAATTVAGLGAAGLVAVGVTGVTARVVAALTSTGAVFGYPSGRIPSAASCTHWLAVQPGAGSCARAATLEASSDLTLGAVAAGLLGLVVAGVVLWRRRRRPEPVVALPAILAPSVAAVAFVLAAIGTAALGASDAMVLATWGAGLFWTAAGVSLAAAVVSSAGVLRALPAALSPAR